MPTLIRFMDHYSAGVVLGLLCLTGVLPAAYLSGDGDDLVSWVMGDGA